MCSPVVVSNSTNFLSRQLLRDAKTHVYATRLWLRFIGAPACESKNPCDVQMETADNRRAARGFGMLSKKPVPVNDTDAISEALAAVNGRASTRVVSASDVVSLVKRADDHLTELGATKAERTGTLVTYRPAGPSANAYRYASRSTLVTLLKKSGGWYLVGAEKADVWPRNPEIFRVKVKPASKAAMIERFATRIDVIPQANGEHAR